MVTWTWYVAAVLSYLIRILKDMVPYSWLWKEFSNVSVMAAIQFVNFGQFCSLLKNSSRVIEWVLERAVESGDEQVAYFYCSKRKTQEGTDPETVLQSLVRQFAWSQEDSKIAPFIKDARHARSDGYKLS